MNLITLQYFIDVYETLNFSKAATKNYVSQTAISFQIKSLETELGTRLFLRNQKPIKATEQADFLYKQALDILQSWKFTKKNINLLNERPLRFAFTLHGGAALLTELMSKIDSEKLSFKLDFLPLSSGNASEAVSQHQADIAIISSHELKSVQKNCIAQLLHSSSYKVAINKKNPIIQSNKIFLKDLNFQDIILLKTSHAERNKNYIEAFEYLEIIDFDFSHNKTAPDFQTMLLYVMENEGIAIIPSHLNTTVFDSKIEFVSLNEVQKHLNLYLLTRKEHTGHAKTIIEQYMS